MPPRTGQLDEISEALGELRGTVKGIEKYVHEERHGVRNLSQKMDGLGAQITREIAAVEARIEIRFEAMSARVALLEERRAKEEGARSFAVAVVQSPLIGWLFAAGVALAAWWKGGKL